MVASLIQPIQQDEPITEKNIHTVRDNCNAWKYIILCPLMNL